MTQYKLFLHLIATISLTGCDLFETTKYEYCGGSGNCCSLIDNRDQSRKTFCVSNAADCVAENQYQSVNFPADPGEGYCQAKKASLQMSPIPKTKFASDVPSSTLIRRFSSRIEGARVHLVNNPDGLDCSFVCNQSSPLCNSVAVPFDYDDELSDLANLFRPSGSAVAKTEIMAIFGETKDECERGDVSLTGDAFSNVGKTAGCFASSSLNVGTAAQPEIITMEISIPQQVTGRVVRSGGNIGANFDVGAEPIILFNGDPNSIYSGQVRKITTAGDAYIAEIGGSCLFMSSGEL
jgi:hypothetical protein